MGSYLTFEPKYKFKNLSEDFDDNFLEEHCYSKGEFCAVSEMNVESKSILDEAIRQKCIWKLSESDKSKKDLWWTYIGYYRTCLKNRLSNRNIKVLDCFDDVKDKVKFNNDAMKYIESCYLDSFNNPNNKNSSTNSILKKDENSFEYAGVYLVPAFFINSYMVKEDLKPNLVASAICDKLIRKPNYCDEFLVSTINWDYPQDRHYKNSIIILISLISLCLVVIFAMVVFVKRKMNRNIDDEIGQQIRNHITEYMKLKDSQD